MASLAPTLESIERKLQEPTGYSHSQIGTYQRCPRRWAYEKILKISPDEDDRALVYGSAGHESLEWIGKGSYLQDAIDAGLRYLHQEGAGRPWQQNCLEQLPNHITGYCTHYLPNWMQEWELVEAERQVSYSIAPGVEWRGLIDVLARHRQTGRYGIFDYKFSSDAYINSLSSKLQCSHQLGNYTMAFFRAVLGEWPQQVGYIFLKKTKGKEAVSNLVSDPSKYTDKSVDITPQFAQFSISVEQNDVAIAGEMRDWYRAYAREGLAALDRVPANFENCFMYGSMCGFAQGCHCGQPLHTLMKEQS